MTRRRAQRALEATALLTAVKAGDFVSWKSSKGTASGRVVSVHTKGKVPAVHTEVLGSKEKPAARVRLYAKSKGGYTPTETHLGLTADKLTPIDALPEPSAEAEEAVVVGSFDDIRRKVADAISDRIEELTGQEPSWCYVVDLGIDWAVYTLGNGTDYWLVSYTMDDATGVTLGDATEVTPQTTYVPEVDDDETGATESADRVEGRLLCAKGTGSDGGRIFGTRIIAYGDSKNGRRYPESVMRSAVPMYEGAKAFDHHRTEAELRSSTVVGLIGYFRNVEATGDGIVGDLCLLPSATHTAEALDASLVLQAEGLNPLVGISHDVMAMFRPVVEGGRRLQEATAISAVNSADVVADPAAGGQATRVVAGGLEPGKGTPVTFKQLLALLRAADSAKRSELLTAHAQIIEACGLTNDEAIRMAEATEPVPATEATPSVTTYARESIVGRQLVKAAVADAGLPEKVTESVTTMLPASWTEADLVNVLETVKAAREGLEKAGFTPSVPALEGVTEESYEKKVKAIDLMLDPRNPGGYRSLKEAYVDFTGIRGQDLFAADFNRRMFMDSVMVTDDRGREGLYNSELRTVESVASGTWSTVLGDSITRRLIAEYSQPTLQAWREIVSSIVPLNDFRTQRIERLGGYGTLPTVLEGAPYQPLTSPTNEEVTYAAGKKGGTEDLTLETIANDDLRAVQRIPVKLGLAAAQTLFRFVMDFFNANPNIYDGSAYFVAGHNNTSTNALSRSGLDAARKGMRKQSAYGDTTDILSLVPRTLLVPTSLENLAWTIVNSAVAIPTAAPDGAASNIPNLHGNMNLIVVDYWDATSATEWFIVADPNMAPTIEIGFYQGQQDPSLFVQNDPTVGSMFNADKVTWKVRHIYGGAVLDFRSAYRGNT